MPKFLNGSVIAVTHWNQRLCTLKIAVDFPPFEAGQFVSIGLEVDNKPYMRPYSLVNVPNRDFIEIYFNTVPEGSLSTSLYQRKVGDSLLVSKEAAGFFTLSEVPTGKHLWLIATGTGIGPYLSILGTSDPWERFEKIVLVQSVSTADELAYKVYIEALQARYPEKLTTVYCVTREQVDGGLPHRIQQCFTNGTLEASAGVAISAKTSQVMLCGNRDMIQDMISMLASRGMKKSSRSKPGHITTEHYY